MSDKPYEIETTKHLGEMNTVLEEINTIASIILVAKQAQEEMNQRRYRVIFRQDETDSFLGYDRD